MTALDKAAIVMALAVTVCLVGGFLLSQRRTLYRTTDGRCWSAFVPNNAEIEQPANGQQQAVKPLYAITVPCK